MGGPPREVKGEAAVIFFDAAGTLIHLVRSAGWHYADVARQHGLAADAGAMEAAFRALWRAQTPRKVTSSPRPDDDRPWWRDLAVSVLRQGAHPPEAFDVDRWFEDVYWRFAEPGVWALYEDVPRCLDRLEESFRLAVLSNFDGRLRLILRDLGIASRFEHIFLSSELGCDKPAADIFLRAMKTMSADPGGCLHVGDDPERDWAGAEAAGLRAFRLQRPEITLDGL